MIIGPELEPLDFKEVIDQLINASPLAERDYAKYIFDYSTDLLSQRHKSDLTSFHTFLPPRLVRAAKEGRLVSFFGAGVSASAGVPLWADLLVRLNVSTEESSDPQVQDDALTAAELIAHARGNEELQNALRKIMKENTTPSLLHYLLAQLAQPLYVTTNYDILFEIAWKNIHTDSPIVITNDGDFLRNGLNPAKLTPRSGPPILLKLHGCSSRNDEELILTRRQYRRHYRSNNNLFEALKTFMSSTHTLFLGFGHRDPEINRQVEDVIYTFENDENKTHPSPALYSLQFDMRERTPEVFAARGIVALKPPLSVDIPRGFDLRTAGLSKSLVDLLGAMDSNVHEQLELDSDLKHYAERLTSVLQEAMDLLSTEASQLENQQGAKVAAALESLRVKLESMGNLASQGIYLLKENGNIRECALPPSLVDPRRKQQAELATRFYVRQAKTYRKPFVSDSDESIFNSNSTIFLCCPLGGKGSFKGLLFAATQVGSWRLPCDLAREFRAKRHDASFVLLDSNGVVLLPPNNEFEPKDTAGGAGEKGLDNFGFAYGELKRLSRRDRLISAIWSNIVPLSQDDDIRSFPPDLIMYSVVSEVPPTRWKLALSIPFPTKLKAF